MSLWRNLLGKQNAPAPPQVQQTPQQPVTQQSKWLIDLSRLMREGKFSLALDQFINPTIAEFEKQYGDSKQRVYCANGPVETLTYLAMHARQQDAKAASERQGAIAVDPRYAYAYFMRGYMAVEQKDCPRALESIGQAVELSPFNAQFLCELGNIYQNAREWAKSMELYERAADNASMYERKGDTSLQRRALRGKAFVLVELQKLDDAENLYRRCLELDSQDGVALRELGYIAHLRTRPVK